jgi:hypothetical protein
MISGPTNVSAGGSSVRDFKIFVQIQQAAATSTGGKCSSNFSAQWIKIFKSFQKCIQSGYLKYILTVLLCSIRKTRENIKRNRPDNVYSIGSAHLLQNK